ncbi:MAG: UDP-N-acetylmuramate dehydrogenase [Bacteroidales bacterium]|nr:UDP-N-acetylmuramate dehydrogenase [Bacteroidales bacterium]
MITRTADFDLSTRNTFRMKVRCALFVEITAEEDLQELNFASLPKPLMVMGGGSNLLFRGDFPGTVLHVAITGAPAWDPGSGLATVGAGVVFDAFCDWAAQKGLWGPENLSLIPGECGASAVQNIGAYGVEAKDILADIRAWDTLEGKFVHISPSHCAYGYRTSLFKTDWKGRYIITYVTYRLSADPRPVLDYGGIRKALEGQEVLSPRLIRDTIIGIRNAKLPDPAVTGSAGSFFCNPVVDKAHFERIVSIAKEDNGQDCKVPHFEVGDRIKVPAAWMIEQCGFKGKANGGARVYRNQPLVIVNESGDATPDEIVALENAIIRAVEAKYGVTLHPEVEHI